MDANYKDKIIDKEGNVREMPFERQRDLWRRGQEKIREKALSKLPITCHGYYKYQCPSCGAVYNMHIQQGLCEITPEIRERIEDLKRIRDRANEIPGVEFEGTMPVPEDCIIGVPISFICPNCCDNATKAEEMPSARHIQIGAEWEETDPYKLERAEDGNFFIMSSVLGQGVPIICKGPDEYLHYDEELGQFVTEKPGEKEVEHDS